MDNVSLGELRDFLQNLDKKGSYYVCIYSSSSSGLGDTVQAFIEGCSWYRFVGGVSVSHSLGHATYVQAVMCIEE